MTLYVKNKDGSYNVVGKKPSSNGGGYETGVIGTTDKPGGAIKNQVKGSTTAKSVSGIKQESYRQAAIKEEADKKEAERQAAEQAARTEAGNKQQAEARARSEAAVLQAYNEAQKENSEQLTSQSTKLLEQIDAQQKREQRAAEGPKFGSALEPRLSALNVFTNREASREAANTLTGGKPYEERGFVGKTAELTTQKVLKLPYDLGTFIPATGEKVFLATKALFNPQAREGVTVKETAKIVGQGLGQSFNPTTPEGLSNDVLLAAPFLPKVAKKLSPIRTTTLEVATAEGTETTRTVGVLGEPVASLKTVKGAETARTVEFGTPTANLAALKEGSSVPTPSSSLGATVLKRNLPATSEPVEFGGSIYPGAKASTLQEAQNLLAQTGKQKSAFTVSEPILDVRALKPEGAKTVVEFARQEKADIYGSFAQNQQFPLDIRTARGLPGDIDLQLKPTTQAKGLAKAEQLTTSLKGVGEPASLKPGTTLIETVNPETGLTRHAVDIHFEGADPVAGLESKPIVGDVLGASQSQKRIKIGGTNYQPLSEQGVRKANSILTLRREGENLFFAPEAHRAKDVADFFYSQETLLRSRGMSSAEVDASLKPLRDLYGPEFFNKQTKANPIEPPPAPYSPPSEAASLRSASAAFLSIEKQQFGSLGNDKPPQNSLGSPGSPQAARFFPEPPSTSIKSPSQGSPLASLPASPRPLPSPPRSSSSSSSRSSPSPSPSPTLFPSPSPSPSPPSPSPLIPSPKNSPSPSPALSPSPSPATRKQSPYAGLYQEQEKGSDKPALLPSFGSKKQQGYDVLVRVKGEFRRINSEPLSKDEALSLGVSNVRNTSAASLKIQAADYNVAAKRAAPVNLNGFYKSKKESGVFIQENTGRITSAGEKRDITFKGIAAKRNKYL